tara:strand:- start:10765 stop:11034 length:270 start_codon:yes stop_codon:yes gene_type:complete
VTGPLLLLVVGGAIVGRLLPAHDRMMPIADWMMRLSICSLLFLLGADTGRNDTVFSSLNTVGVESIAIAVGGIVGCGPFAILLQRALKL